MMRSRFKTRRRGPGAKKPVKTDATQSASAILDDPFFDRISAHLDQVGSKRTLGEIRSLLSSCVISTDMDGKPVNGAKVNFENFIKNLQGCKEFSIGSAVLTCVRTRGSLFIITNTIPDTLYELSPAIMHAELKRKTILMDKTGKAHYLCRINSRDLAILQKVASTYKPMEEKKPTTLEPDTSNPSVDLDQFVKQLKVCGLVEKTEEFSTPEFARSIKFVTTYNDDNDNTYYFIVAGENDDSYRLYVNCDPNGHLEHDAMFVLSYRRDRCKLYREC